MISAKGTSAERGMPRGSGDANRVSRQQFLTVLLVAGQENKRLCVQSGQRRSCVPQVGQERLSVCASKVFGKAFRGSLSKGATENRAKRSTNAKVEY